MTTDMDRAALMRAPALSPAQATMLWERFTPRHRESIREKMLHDNLLLHQVLNRFKTLRIDPYLVDVTPPAPTPQASEVADDLLEAEDLL